MNKLVPMERINLQDIYNKGDWRKKFEGYKKQVTKFRSLVEENKTWGEEDLSDLIYVQRNSIANNGQGVVSKTEFEKIKGKWTSLLAIIKETVSANDITDEQYNNFINIIYECCEKQKKVAANRIIAAFLPGVVTATVNEKDFNLLSKNLRNDFEDYPTPTGNWLSDNKSFIKFCREHLNFVDPWESSLFAWEIKLYYDGKNKETKGGNEMNMESEDILVELLLSNHNLILTGAPGTGKTYLAKEIAQQLIFGEVKKEMTDEEKKQFNEQCGFVQFHPSYDYTDFVEGIRPNDNNGFERRDGVFIKFCNKALMNIENSKKGPDVLSMENSVKKKYEYLLSKIDAGEIQEVTLRTNKKMLVDKISNNKNIILRANQTTTTTHTVSLNRILKLSEKFHDKNSLDNISNINTEITDVIGGCNASAYWAVLHLVYEQELEILSNSTSEREKNYVFIIDEINRGEISKIFGELFYSIDPGYRGKDGKVKTQYASMQHEPNDFDVALGIKERDECGWFYVPENVYIIGTMNDIDRSVESMDFAFRRRFAFAEIKADENVGMLNDLKWKNEAIKRMNSLNKMIWHEEKENEKEEDKCIEGLSSAYHIGASYFLKLKNYDGDFNQLWKYHLDGLLREYLRGMPDTEAKMVKLKKAYDSNNTTTNGSDSNNG